MDFSPEKMKARFAQLTKQRAAIRAKADPLREKRDKAVQDFAAKDAAAIAEIEKAEKGLFEIDQEAAMIARALGGKTG